MFVIGRVIVVLFLQHGLSNCQSEGKKLIGDQSGFVSVAFRGTVFKPIDILSDDCSGTFTFEMRSSFASLILCQVRHKIEGECTRTRLPMTTLCCLLCQYSKLYGFI